MPNATNQIDYPNDLGQDYRPPSVVAPPGTAAVSPPVYRSPFLSQDEIAQMETLNRLRPQIQDLPYAQAEQAVNAAIRFQAMRGYQRDLASGMSAEDAAVKWFPNMFAGQKTGGLSGGAALIRAAQPRLADIKGTWYRYQGGRAVPLTPVQPETIKPTQQETDRRNLLQSDYKDAVRSRDDAYKAALKVAITDEEKQAQNMAYQQINEANQRIEQIRNQLLGGVPTAPAAPTPVAPVASPASTTAIPLPKTKSELKKDQTYQTPRGLMRFDGERFHPING